MDRTAGMPGWMVIKQFPTQASNCIMPVYVVQTLLEEQQLYNNEPQAASACANAYVLHVDPATHNPYVANPTGTAGIDGYPCGPACEFPIPAGYPGFDPTQP